MMRQAMLSHIDRLPITDLLKITVARKKAYTCLLYHRVVDEVEQGEVVNWSRRVRKADFIWQMSFIKNHCVPIPLTEMVERVRNGIRADRFYVSVSFDDGYMDNYTQAFPIIQEIGIPITVFLTTGFIDEPDRVPWWDVLEHVACNNRGRITFPVDGNQHDFDLEKPGGRLHFFRTFSERIKRNPRDESRVMEWLQPYLPVEPKPSNEFMRWDQIRCMAASPLVELAPHTCWHSNLADLSSLDEIRASRDRIQQKIGSVADLFSYPFGSYDTLGAEPLFDYLEAQGIKAAFTSTPDTLNTRHHQFLLPRVPISGHDSQTLFLLKLLTGKFVFRLQQSVRRLTHQSSPN